MNNSPSFRRAAENKKANKYVTQKMIRQVCFLICQGFHDDIQRKVKDFSQFSEEFGVLSKLKLLLKSPHEDLRAVDVQELLNFTIQEAVKARKEVLGFDNEEGEKSAMVHKEVDREMSPVDSEAQARKRRAAAAAHRR